MDMKTIEKAAEALKYCLGIIDLEEDSKLTKEEQAKVLLMMHQSKHIIKGE